MGIDEKGLRAQAIAIAEAILRSEVGVVEGAQRLAGLRHGWAAESDPDFLYMVAVDSDTDHLPTGPARQHWEPGVLAQKDEELAELSRWYDAGARAACQRIVDRYGPALRAS